MLLEAVVLDDRVTIECYRNQDLNISTIGFTPNIYVARL